MTPNEALDIAVANRGSMQKLAEELGITKGAIGQWKMEGRRIPAEHCPHIERLTGGAVTRYELNPDVFGADPAKARSRRAAAVV